MEALSMHYIWWIVALLLIGGEVIMPGYFMLWIGIAAAGMGIVMLVFPDMGALAQAVLFAVFTFVSCFVYWKMVRPRIARVPSGNERLNRRGEQLIGETFTVCDAIVHGRGKVRVGDSVWLVTGPDLPAGATVRVLGVDGTTLRVEAVAVG
ncbi:NfeD family protein [Bacillus sp. NP157]|nr:NfeD family protein [Bacillus sp. NP157]